jgi:dolichol-phosphate mannosyltransferase
MLKFAWTGITSFSIIPLRLGILLGLVTSLFAFYQLIEALYVKFFTNEALPGWASIFGVMTLLFGIMFILIGVLGEYIGRILIEVRGRPKFIISEEIGAGKINVSEARKS